MSTKQQLDAHLAWLAAQPYHYDFATFQAWVETYASRYDVPVITVGGSNGKGGVVHTLMHALMASGYRVAAYTSPHLACVRERLLIQGKVSTYQQWVDALDWVRERPYPGSWFASITLAAHAIIQRHAVDVIILEVGLGGRFDPVNAWPADLALITHVSLEHQAQLGSTLSAIAWQKAGIIHQHTQVILGREIPDLVADYARKKGAPISQYGHDFNLQTLDDTQCVFQNCLGRLWLSKPRFMPSDNWACVLHMAFCLQTILPIPWHLWSDLRWLPRLFGRGHPLRWRSVVHLDGAHNPASFDYLASRQDPSKSYRMVFCLRSDRSMKDCLAPCRGLVSHIYYVTGLPGMHDISACQAIANVPVTEITQCNWVQSARKLCSPDFELIIAGSFLLVSMVQLAEEGRVIPVL